MSDVSCQLQAAGSCSCACAVESASVACRRIGQTFCRERVAACVGVFRAVSVQWNNHFCVYQAEGSSIKSRPAVHSRCVRTQPPLPSETAANGEMGRLNPRAAYRWRALISYSVKLACLATACCCCLEIPKPEDSLLFLLFWLSV